jgi:hypothetical protein
VSHKNAGLNTGCTLAGGVGVGRGQAGGGIHVVSTRLDLMVEMFNLFNRTNFTNINATFGPGAYPSEPLPTFGQFVRAGPPRQIQLALRINF